MTGRITVLVLVALAGALVAFECAPPPRWFLVAGQSNAVGASDQPTTPVDGPVQRATGRFTLRITDPYVHEPPWGPLYNSPWPEFGRSLPGTTGLMTTALPGSCLLDWGTAQARWDPELPGGLYDRALDTWGRVHEPPVRAVLWLQGECEAYQWREAGWTAEEVRSAYAEALMALADAFYRDLEAPMVVATVSLGWCRWENVDCDPALFEPDDPDLAPIVAAIEDAIADHPWIEPGPVTHDLRLAEDGVHIWDVNELGRRWAAAVQALPRPASSTPSMDSPE